MAKIYDFKALTSKGKELDFAQFEGKEIIQNGIADLVGYLVRMTFADRF